MVETEQGAVTDDADDVPMEGQVLAGKYVIERVIGQGGMGSVVAARHQELGQRVAVKFLRAEVLGQQAAVERFLREARAVVSIKSEHVAKVSDVGKLENGAPYMVMEYLMGKGLGAILASATRVSLADAIDYVVQAAEAIAEAHSLGIVHRDLKPANLFLTRRADGSGLVKVLDFGIAKALPKPSQDHGLTATGSALGTPMYMSPEQVRDAKNADPRTDIWGLGTILYELLGGKAPFEADTLPALCAMIVSDPLQSVRELRPEVPAGLDAIVARCLEKKPVDRYQTVAELARDIAPYAPLRCEMILERIVRILEGAEATIGWSQRDSLSETLASAPGKVEVPASRREASALRDDTVASAPILAEASTGAERKPFADTATPTSWGTEEPPTRTRTRLLVAGVAVLACATAVAVWLGSGTDEDARSAATAAEKTAPAAEPPSAAPSPAPAAPTAEPPATVQPSASTTSVASAAPSVSAKRPPQRPGGGAKPPPPPGDDLDVISDRK
jgi:eukaryotic-like serine/threonine-protein kinase